jgi:hypothetical protein
MRQPNRNIPRDVRAVCLDESCYLSDKARAEGMTKLLSVYVTDCSVNHHVCSLTPARWCIGVYHVVEFRDDVSEEDRERLQDEVGYPESGYFDCGQIDKAKHVKFSDDPEIEDDDEFLESAVEHYQGNCPF